MHVTRARSTPLENTDYLTIIVLRILVSVLASYIYTLSYLLGYLPSRVNLLVLLFLSLKSLLLCFLPLLGSLKALRYLFPIMLTIL